MQHDIPATAATEANTVVLTTGALLNVATAARETAAVHPDIAQLCTTAVIQVLAVQQIKGRPQYKARVGDGEHALVCMLSSRVGDLVACGEIATGTIVQVDEFWACLVENRMMFVIYECLILKDLGRHAGPILAPTIEQLTTLS